MNFTIGLRNPPTSVTVEADHMLTNGETVRFVNGSQFGEEAITVAIFRTEDIVFSAAVGGITDFHYHPVISHITPTMPTDEQRARDREILSHAPAIIAAPQTRIGTGLSAGAVGRANPVDYPDPRQAWPTSEVGRAVIWDETINLDVDNDVEVAQAYYTGLLPPPPPMATLSTVFTERPY